MLHAEFFGVCLIIAMVLGGCFNVLLIYLTDYGTEDWEKQKLLGRTLLSKIMGEDTNVSFADIIKEDAQLTMNRFRILFRKFTSRHEDLDDHYKNT